MFFCTYALFIASCHINCALVGQRAVGRQEETINESSAVEITQTLINEMNRVEVQLDHNTRNFIESQRFTNLQISPISVDSGVSTGRNISLNHSADTNLSVGLNSAVRISPTVRKSLRLFSRSFLDNEHENHDEHEREASTSPLSVQQRSSLSSSVTSRSPLHWPNFWPQFGSHPITGTPRHSPIRRRTRRLMEEPEFVSLEDLPEVNPFGPNGTPPRTPSRESFVEIRDDFGNRNSNELINEQRESECAVLEIASMALSTDFVTPPSKPSIPPMTPRKKKYVVYGTTIGNETTSFYPYQNSKPHKFCKRISEMPNRYSCNIRHYVDLRKKKKKRNLLKERFARKIRTTNNKLLRHIFPKSSCDDCDSVILPKKRWELHELIDIWSLFSAEKIDKRKSWIEQMRNNPQMDISLLDEQLKSVKQVFIQGNADTHLEALGYRVGFVLVEKIAKDLPRIITELERMKFLCKEFWTAAFGKQVDNLRTNHQGVYVVQDNKFFILLNFAEGKQCVEESAIYLAFPCGVIRGALYNLGITSLVTSSVETLPAVKFHVHMQQKS
ncbi:Trafficking protein particle complex subunit 6B [Dirofilaria immitis]|nr:Trafficking protein particle complex subunit 6B [Dirofilaria immitis]